MKVIRNIGLSIIGGMILNLLISNYYNLFMNRNYKKYINILYIKYWTYGMWGVIVLEFILFSFILVSFLKLRDLKTNFLGHYILLLCELILCELILFIVLIIKWKSAMNIWWTYLSVGCCGSFIFGILLFFQRFNSSYKNNYGNHRNDRIDKLKSNIKTDKTRLNKKKLEKNVNKIKLGIRVTYISVTKFLKGNCYIIKRLTIALIISLVAAIIVSVWYSINFDDFQNDLNSFLNLNIKMSSNASNMSAFIFALILDILPIVFTIAVMFKIKELREKLLKEWKKEKINYLKLEIKKNYFQIISFIICFLALACVLFSLTVWGKAKFLTGIMLIGLWFVLFGISILIVLLLSFLLDWLKKDNYRDSSLPRTTIFWGFVAAIVAALL